MFDLFRANEAEGLVIDLNDLNKVKMRGENLLRFQNDWNEVMTYINIRPPEHTLENIHRSQNKHCNQLKDVFANIVNGEAQNGENKSYDKLHRMVEQHLETWSPGDLQTWRPDLETWRPGDLKS